MESFAPMAGRQHESRSALFDAMPETTVNVVVPWRRSAAYPSGAPTRRAARGFDCFIAAGKVGGEGEVVGIDMTEEMLAKSRATARSMGQTNVEFRMGLLEDMPVEDGWADVVISNGVINLCADKQQVFSEIRRILRPGGYLQLADIANGQPVPEEAVANIDLWTA